MKQTNHYHALFFISGTYIMDIEHAFVASDYIETKKIIGIHRTLSLQLQMNIVTSLEL